MCDKPADNRSGTPYDSPLTGEPPPGHASTREPEEPKLSIQHLMIWTACVAVYMSAYRTIAIDRMTESVDGVQTGLFGAWGVLGGSYLAGLLLFIVRRARRQKFPRSGGEILWIIGGIGVVQSLGVQLLFALDNGGFFWYSILQLLFGLLIWLPVYVYAIVRTRGYWRSFFILLIVVSVVWFFVQITLVNFFGPQGIYSGYLFRTAVVGSALAIVALLDLRRTDKRYAWPHWIGIILDLSSKGLSAAFHIVILCTREIS